MLPYNKQSVHYATIYATIIPSTESAGGGGEMNFILNLKITWYYDPDNESAMEAGEEYQEDYPSLELNIVPINR